MAASMTEPAYDTQMGGDDRLPDYLVWKVTVPDGGLYRIEIVSGHSMAILDGVACVYVVYLWRNSPLTKIVRAFKEWVAVEEVPMQSAPGLKH
jgi:hypothetical protein